MRVVVWAPLGALLLGGVAAVVFAALQRRRGALPAGFRGGRLVRGVVLVWAVGASCVTGGGSGAILGAAAGVRDALRDDRLAEELAPRVEPLRDGLIHAVGVHLGRSPDAWLAGAEPIPVAPLRAVLNEPEGVALAAGLRRVVAGSQVPGAQHAPGAAALVGHTFLRDHLELVGLRAPLDELADALPRDPRAGITRAELGGLVGAHLLPGLAAEWLGRGVRHTLLWIGLAWLAALAVPVGLLWLVEWARRRRVVAAG